MLLLVIVAGNFGLWFSTKDLKMSSKTCHLFSGNFTSTGRVFEKIIPVHPYCSIILSRMIYNKYKIQFRKQYR